jgi:hypothetical protein
MRVIRHESGWDIALDMVFTEKKTAEAIAERIRHAVHALIRGAVDETMCSRAQLPEMSVGKHSPQPAGQPLAGAQMLGRRKRAERKPSTSSFSF